MAKEENGYWEDKMLRFRSVPILYYPLKTLGVLALVALVLACAPFYFAAALIVRSYQLFLMLFGYWWCAACGKRFWGIHNKSVLREYRWGDDKFHPSCTSCSRQHMGRAGGLFASQKWKL